MSDSQHQFLKLLLESLGQALGQRNLSEMEKLLQQGASMARQMLDSK